MYTIITGAGVPPVYSGYPFPLYGPWNQPVHNGTIQLGNQTAHLIPILHGYHPAFPYFGPYVPFRQWNNMLKWQ